MSQAERIARTALEEPDRHSAIRLLRSTLPETESELPGIRNVGMFATYHLRERVPARQDWQALVARGKQLLPKRGRDLVEALGFEIESRGATTHVLRIRENGQASAVAIFLDENESPETLSGRFRESTPVSTALAKATNENLRYVVLTRGREIRLYGTSPDVGVGRKGRAETYVEANLALLPSESAAYLPLIFSAEALRPGGTFDDVLEHSRDFAAGIGERLRDRVYDEVVPRLAVAVGRDVAEQEADGKLDGHLDEIYEAAMVVLFRLLFVAYAEDKNLLPYEKNERYREHSLKMLARSMADEANEHGLEFAAGALTLWHRVEELWHAVDQGRPEWGVPLYNGGLFSEEPEKSPVGARIAELELDDRLMGPVLFHLLVDQSEDGVYGPVDFAALSVREFGTIYEGLLESSLAVAKEPLARDNRGRYVPADEAEPEIKTGEIFLQGNDGARKATGSYFTPHFAVEHLLDHALEPSLRRHLERVQQLVEDGHEGKAAREFFNYRVADIAMGSGHFLVAAVDRIEALMSDFLERHPLPGVKAELERLRKAAQDQLGPWSEGEEIERASLLRRQIARRCIYGVDINHVAVDLARVSLWIHTFVEGVPLSFLDRTLVHGDSLFGAANAEEARSLLSPDGEESQADIFSDIARSHVDAVKEDLDRLAQSSDATDAEIDGAREAYNHVREKLRPLRQALDIAIASTVDSDLRGQWTVHVDRLFQDDDYRRKMLRKAEPNLLEPRSVHFPLEFPEVFYREPGGFDCVIGNPPWEETSVDYDRFWTRYMPGLHSLSEAKKKEAIAELSQEQPDLGEKLKQEKRQVARTRALMTIGRFPTMGVGNADLYKAFSWRFLNLVRRPDGAIGVVTPRALFQSAGSAGFREEILDGTWDVRTTTLVNRSGWVFPDVHPQYSVVLAVLASRSDKKGVLHVDGPFTTERGFASASEPSVLEAPKVVAWSERATIPVLPGPRSPRVLSTMMGHPELGAQDRVDFTVHPVQGDFNATTGRLDRNSRTGAIVIAPARPQGHLPVIGGEAFDLWSFNGGKVYGWADPARADRILFEKRKRQSRRSRSAFYNLPEAYVSDRSTLPHKHPRIAFRDISRATDSRTIRVGAVPGNVYLTNKAPYLFVKPGAHSLSEPFLLGVLGSRPLDWVARRYVEISVNFYLFNYFPVPVLDDTSPLVKEVIEIAGALSCQSPDLESWANHLGRSVEPLSGDRQDALEAELDALVGHLYGLEEDDVVHLMETFHDGWNHEPHLEAVLDHFRRWDRQAQIVSAES